MDTAVTAKLDSIADVLETATGLESAQRPDVSVPARLQRIRDALSLYTDQTQTTFESIEDAINNLELADLIDVSDALAPVANQVLQFDGNLWVSSTLPAGITDHGDLTGRGDDDHTQYHNDARALTWLNGLGFLSKSITIESPTADDDITIFRTDRAITITQMVAVIVGGTSAVYSVKFGTDRTSGTEVVTGGTTCNSTTTGTVTTSFNDATVPADSFLWVDMGTITGTVTQFHLTIFYTEDA